MTVTPSRTPDTRAVAVPAARSAGDGAVPSSAVTRGFLARATLVTASLSLAGAVLGLVRDQALARLFGAGSATDAFLVAWTVPEFAATLLIEDGLAFALIPAFSAALAGRAQGGPGDPVRALVAGTLPRLSLAFVAVSALLVAAAPVLVRALAPGLPHPGLAVDCTRLTATCALSFGLAGYCSAALRAHRRFVAPAAIYIAYNTGIVTGMFVLGGRWGVRSAAAGVAAGGLLMVAVQLPSLWRQLRTRPPADPQDGGDSGGSEDSGGGTCAEDGGDGGDAEGGEAGSDAEGGEADSDAKDGEDGSGTKDGGNSGSTANSGSDANAGRTARPMDLTLIGTVLLFALCRQSQVLVERFLASSLPSGAISHLNYAQKVAQLPMVLSLILCTVTFPVVARALAEGDTERARTRVEHDLALAACLVLLGAAAVIACAPQIIELLFQRGAFTARDTAATSAVMRVYALGLLGQTLVGVLVRSYFSAGRGTWYPVGAMLVGVVVTSWTGALTVGPWGATGIAAANAAGITVTAALLLVGAGLGTSGGGRRRSPRGVPVGTRRVLREVSRPVRAAVAATVAGAFASSAASAASGPGSPVAGLAAGAATVTAVFVLLGRVLNAPGLALALRSARTVTRRVTHALFR